VGKATRLFAVFCIILSTTIATVLSVSPSQTVAAIASTPTCSIAAGTGGTPSATLANTRGGHGCVVIKYSSNGSSVYDTFLYTGTDQTWTVPNGITNAEFFLLGAGGGAVPLGTTYGSGAGGGFASGSYTVSPGQTFTVIVGQAGGGVLGELVSANCFRTPATYGGGGRSGSCYGAGQAFNNRASSGGGRSAIRLSGATTDLVTAGGGGGGGWTGAGAPGGGLLGLSVGTDVTGGTQSAGGTTTSPATNGAAHLGGNGHHNGGGGGGGCFGGGGGYWVQGGAGGSSCVSLLTNGTTSPGAGATPGGNINATASSPITSTSAACVSGVAIGGETTSDAEARGGHGCFALEYVSGGTTYFDTFNYVGRNQTWTVPSGVSSVVFHALGAGGGAGRTASNGTGGGGGYATGQYSVTAGDTYTVIVGQGGKRQGFAETVSLSGATARRNASFGGGASGMGSSAFPNTWASGGGRSAIRLSSGTDDIMAAGGGGGGGYTTAGGAGGGVTGVAGTGGGAGGTQIAGGAGGADAEPGTAGIKYAGGYAGTVTTGSIASEGGGGGGGWYGGGGGDDNTGGGGGSSYVALLTNGYTLAGNGRLSALVAPTLTTSPTIAGPAAVGGTLIATGGIWATTGPKTWRWRYSADGITYSDISGATAITHSPTQAGYYRALETESNLLGTVNAPTNVIQVLDPVTVDCTPTAGTFTHCKRFNFYGGPQTFTTPNDLPIGSSFTVEVWGAGGGGVCCNYFASDRGGGAGGYIKSTVTVLQVNETFNVVVGERGEARDAATSYGGGGAGGPSLTSSASTGSSGGGMSGLFAGSGTTNPVVIAGGGGGASAGINTDGFAGGGGGVGSGGQATNAATSGRAGTSVSGGAAATTTTQCAVSATAGTQYQGGRGCGTLTVNTEGGGGGGGGWYGGGGGNHQTSTSGAQNGGGGGGSGYRDTARTSLLTSTTGGQGITQPLSGGRTSDQYVTFVGTGGNGYLNTIAGVAGGNGMIVVQWAAPPTARADSVSGGSAIPITISPVANDTGASGSTINASSVRLCSAMETAPNCTATTRTVIGEGSYSVNTSTGVVTFTGEVGFVGTSTISYSVADSRGTRASNTISVTTLTPPTARPDESAAQKGDSQSVSPLANDSAAGSGTIDVTTLKLCGVSPVESSPTCTKTSITVANEGTYAIINGRVAFTASSTFVGSRVLNYVVQDSFGQNATSTITFTALPPPAVSTSSDSQTVNHTSTATFSPLNNDSAGSIPVDYTTQGTVALNTSSLKLCGTGETISTGCTRSSLVVANEGTWTLSGTTVTFAPLVTFYGVATPVSYVVCNTVSGTWAPATPPSTCGSSALTATVNAPTAPTPQTDSASGQLGAMLAFSPLSNDQGTSLTASRMRLCDPTETAPACNSTSVVVANEGTWTFDSASGIVLFTPLSLFHGTATPITYTGTDIVGATFSSTMSATIQAPTAPSAVADTATGAADRIIAFTPLSNDSGSSLAASSLSLCGPSDTPPVCTESSITVNGQGTWSVDAQTGTVAFAPVGGFVGNATAVRYSVQDIISRNTSSTLSVTVTAIVPPSAPDLLSSSDTGTSTTDNITSDTTPDVTASGVNDGDTVTLTAVKGGTTVTCTYVASPSTSSCTLATLSDGSWSVTSQRTDSQNNVSSVSGASTLIIDTASPSQPMTPDLDALSDDGTSSTDNRTSDTSPAVGTNASVAGEIVTMSATDGSTTVTCSYDPATDTTCDLATLTNGTWSVSALVTDPAGNTSAASAALSIIIDTTITTTTTTTTTTTVPSPTSTTQPSTTTTIPVTPAAIPSTTSTSIPSTTSTTSTTLPNSKISYDISQMDKIVNDIATVAGMPKDGWVKVDRTATSITITTSDGLLIQIGAKVKSSVVLRLNSRGMPIFEANDFITIAGGGLMPSSPASTWLFSTPKQLGQLTTNATGTFNEEYSIGEDVEAGDHTAQLNGIAPDGTLRVVEVAVEILASQSEVTPVPSEDSSNDVPPTTPLSTSGAIALVASALVLLTVSRPKSDSLTSGLVLSGRSKSDSSEEENVEREDAGGDVASVKVSYGDDISDELPDRIRMPRLQRIDAAIKKIADRFVQVSPMFARVADDGAYARSLLGILWLSLPIAGIALGIASAFSTDFTMMIPSLGLIIAIAILGVLDAFAGLMFVTTFAVAVLAGGGLNSTQSVRGLLGIAVFSFAPVMIAAATRPFRRKSHGPHLFWNRTVDFALTALFGSWAAGSMYSALPSLTTFRPAHSDRVDLIHIVFICAIAFRWISENGARIFAPNRLRIVQVEEFDEPSRLQRLTSYLVRTAVFAFVAVVFIGNNWALWTGAAMYLAPKIVDEFSDGFPNLPLIYRCLPRNLIRVVAMLFVCLWWGNLVNNEYGDSKNVLLYAFVLLSIPGLTLGTIDWFARDGRKWESTAVSKLLGVIVLIIGIMCVRGIIP
jgi:CshA-type fibril repeat protein